MRFQRLAGRLLYGDPRLRSIDAVARNRRGQPELWKYGISGDLPIVLATISDSSHLDLLSDLLKAHEYLRGKGMLFDLVVAERARHDLPDGSPGLCAADGRKRSGTGVDRSARRRVPAPRRPDAGRGSTAASRGGARGDGRR